MEAVASSFIDGFFGVLVACVALYRAYIERANRIRTQEDLGLTKAVLDFSEFAAELNDVFDEVEGILADTKVDRTLMLRAWNEGGNQQYHWTTAVIQIRNALQKVKQYINFELDTDYANRLTSIEQNGYEYYITNEMPLNCEIRRVYEREGVKASLWAHIMTIKLNKKQRVMIYMSYSTMLDEGLSRDDQTACVILTSRLKSMAKSYHSKKGKT
jgi:hypothetical protein